MDFRANFRGRFSWDGIAIAGDRRVLAGAGAVLFCAAAAAAVAAVPSASAGMDEPSSTITVSIPKASPDTVFADPADAAVQLFATLRPGDSLKALLERSGVSKPDVKTAAGMVAQALPAGVPDGTELEILLGPVAGKGARRLERLSFQPSQAFRLVLGRTIAGKLRLARDPVSVDATPQHFSGAARGDLFWSLRAAGVPAPSAREYLDALATRLDLRQVRPRDRFDLVIDHVRDAAGKTKTGPVLYAGLRRDGRTVDVVRWTVGNRTGWFDPSKAEQRVDGFEQPVRGRVTSRFGYRIHPILRFGRFHDGVDYGAAWGSPVFAAADGVVTGTGWSGGYGRQVRLAHAGGVVTSYSHLSRIIVAPRTRVQRGQIIGLVGSSGFSTGAHLHFEVRRGGHPVDPASFRPVSVERISATDLAGLKARLEQLRSI